MPDPTPSGKNEATKPGQELKVESGGRATRITVKRMMGRTCKRLNCDRIRFNTDSAIVMPSGLRVIAAALQVANEEKDGKKRWRTLIASHTDSVDTTEKNQALSEARAKGVLHLILGEMGPWSDGNARENNSLAKDIRQTLQWGYQVWSLGGDPGKVDNAPRDAALDAKMVEFGKAFDARFTTNYTQITDPLVAHWKRICNLYARTLMNHLNIIQGAQGKLLRDYGKGVVWLDETVKSMGCGEKFPLDGKPYVENKDVPENRRTEFLFFEEGQEPLKMAEEPLTPDLVYGPKKYTFDPLDCPQPTFFGQPIPDGNVVFVIDCSGSMAYNADSKSADRISLALRALNLAIDDLPDGSKFAIVSYSEPGKMNCWPRPADGVITLRDAEPGLKASAGRFVNSLRAGGTTATGEALKQAFKTTGFNEGKPKVIKLLSDGEPNPPRSGKNHVQERELIISDTVTDAGGAWQVDTIGFFDKKEAENTKDPLVAFMKDLAAKNQGKFAYVHVPFVAKTVAGK